MSIYPYCRGTGCPLAHSCERAKGKDVTGMAYFSNVPYDHEKKRCEMYWGLNQNFLLKYLKDILKGRK